MLSQVGAYSIVRQLGQGGMGAVFEGVHGETGQRVAIKLLLPHLSHQPEVVRRFFNEARAASMIGHPAVVEVFDVGRLPDGGAFMVIEYIAGETLRAHLERHGPLGAAALPIVRDIAAALVMAHQKQIIHRDLKPDNVMLAPAAGGALRVKVLDFGIAKIAQDAELAAGMGVRTKTGMVLGTPTYMSPEQCRGTGVGAPTDVYALGAMLHQLVAGQPPFAAKGVGEMIAAHIYDQPTPLSRLVGGVDPALEALVLAMLAKESSARPTMAQVHRTLEDLAAGRRPNAPTMVLPPSSSAAATQLSMNTPPPVSVTAEAEAATRPRRTWLVVGVGAGVAAVATAVLLLFARASQPAAAPPAPGATPAQAEAEAQAPPTVAPPAVASDARPTSPNAILWFVKSDPPRADVVRIDDGVVLGHTPWYIERQRADGTVAAMVRKAGYADELITLDRAANTTLHVRLTRRAGAAKPHAPWNSKSKAEEDDLDVKPLK